MRSEKLRGAVLAAASVFLLSCADTVTGPRSISSSAAGTRAAAASRVVISQVYGGGGNSGAPLQSDYVELFNAGSATQDLTGWSVQYASATGTGLFAPAPLSGSLAPGQYYLVKLFGGTNGSPLIPSDASGSLNLSGTVGKVALADISGSLGCNGGSSPCDATQLSHIIDLVGYGSANFSETATAPALSNSTAGFRRDNGCVDSNNNSADFTTGAPAPRNRSSALAPCNVTVGPLATVTVGNASTTIGASVSLTANLSDANGLAIDDPAATFVWTTSDAAIARVSSTSGSNATITGVAAGSATITVVATSDGVQKTGTAAVSVAGGGSVYPSSTVVSEIHYDNPGTDANERIEIEGDAGSSLEGWTLVLYNGSDGASYSTTALGGTIPATCGARGVVVLPFPVNGIQNGPDAWALVNAEAQVTEFRSYEGTFTATNGPALGLTSSQIEADESVAPNSSYSVQRAGNGVWFGPRASTFGECNPPEPLGAQGSISLSSGKTSLALGMQTQFFYSGNDAAGQPLTSVVYSTSDETVITVDQRGVVSAHRLGTARLIATAPDGAVGSVDMNVYLAPGSSGIRLGHNTEFGEPRDADPSDDFIIRRAQYTVSYNPSRGGANWVSWNLDASHVGESGRCSGTCYSADTALIKAGLPAYTTADWVSGSQYDRGHMAPSADWTASEADNNTTFFLTNFLPQRPDLNQGPWERLESALRDSVAAGRQAYVIAGGIFTGGTGLGTLLGLGKIWIPDSTYKIAIITSPGVGIGAGGTLPPGTTVLAVNMPNVQGIRGSDWRTFITTISRIESSTGYDYLDLLSEPTECLAEGRNCAPTARITSAGGWTANEGQSLTFSSATSTDPNQGDVLTAAWTVNGAAAGNGEVLAWSFNNDGVYEVKLTVSDAAGFTSVAVATVEIANVAPAIAQFAGASILRGEIYTATGSFTDPGADQWTAGVNYGDGATSPLALNGQAFSLSHSYPVAGTYTVTVMVNDGAATSSRAATVVVKTATMGLAELEASVPALGLNGGQTNSLQVKLRNAAAQLEKGNTNPAENMVGAFINELTAMIENGRVAGAAGQPLLDYAHRIIASM